MTKFMTATEARKNFYSVIEKAGHPGVPVIITHEGLPKVVVMSYDEFEGWQETFEIMRDRELSAYLVRELKKSPKQLMKGTISWEKFKKKLHL